MTLEELEKKVVQWADDRNLIIGSAPSAQLTKLLEEYEELKEACYNRDLIGIQDGIGDMMVVLTIIARQTGYNLFTCYAAAYLEIKDRKGKMVNGVFVKEQ